MYITEFEQIIIFREWHNCLIYGLIDYHVVTTKHNSQQNGSSMNIFRMQEFDTTGYYDKRSKIIIIKSLPLWRGVKSTELMKYNEEKWFRQILHHFLVHGWFQQPSRSLYLAWHYSNHIHIKCEIEMSKNMQITRIRQLCWQKKKHTNLYNKEMASHV